MKKLSQKQKVIIAVAIACIIVLVSVVITVTTVRKRAQKQEYERISMEESRLALSSLSESSTEETSESTSAPTTEEPTTQKPPVTTEKKKDKPKAETTTQKKSSQVTRIQTLIYGPIPAPADTGGLYIVSRGAGNLREDPNGGYLLDVWAEIANNEYNNPIFNDPIEGRLAFSVSKFDDTFVLRDVIDVGTLQPGEQKKKTVTVHVDENEPYQVYFYTV